VELESIAAALSEIGISPALALLVDAGIVLVGLKEQVAGKTETILGHLRGSFPAAFVPRAIYAIEAFPLSPNGTIDRGKVSQMLPGLENIQR
jgi:hypothetical protein